MSGRVGPCVPLVLVALLAAPESARTRDAKTHPRATVRTLEDIYGDTGNTFQGSIGLVNFEGTAQNPAHPSYGIAIDDMFVEWREFTLDPDVTDCATGSCAVLELPTTNLYQANTVVAISLLERTPHNSACAGTGAVCFPAEGPPCTCVPARNDCDLDGDFFGPGDDDDCDDDGVADVVVRATSVAEPDGEIVILNRASAGSFEYRGNLTVSFFADSPGVLLVADNGGAGPEFELTYLDYEDGTGHLCQNDVIPANQGHVVVATRILVPTCDVRVVETFFTDNGDGDHFADTDETLTLGFKLQNNCGIQLTGCTARLSSNSPYVECIKQAVVTLGTLNAGGNVVTAPDAFVFKISGGADRQALGLGPQDPLASSFNVAIRCDQIDGVAFPQSFSIPLDLNLSELGQTPFAWIEGFEGGTTLAASKFVAENLDYHIPGNNNPEGLVNGDGWRCQYSDPDWHNAATYGNDRALECYPGMNLAHADAVFWQVDGTGVPGPAHGGRAKSGSKSMYYGVFLTSPAGEFTTPLAVVESVATRDPINLGAGYPKLSFWHQVSLADHRMVAPVPPLRSADRGVVQIQLADGAGQPAAPWTNLTPIQNGYDEQAEDNFFNCTFDPIDDGNTEDDFFDPADPDRDTGPSSTCFPEWSYGYQGDTECPFVNCPIGSFIGNATTPPAASDSPSLGVGTWVKSIADLSPFRGRRARVRYLVSSLKNTQETWAQQFPTLNPGPQDDGWWIDDVQIDGALTNPAQLVNDGFVLRSCAGSGAPCIAQCAASSTACSATSPCAAGQGSCVRPCAVGDSCTGPPPACGPNCTDVTAHVFVEPAGLLDPSSVTTAAPGQVVSFDAARGAGPSSADACLSGVLQFRFCASGDPDGGGQASADADCDDAGDAVLRSWTESPRLTLAPQTTAAYAVEARCSTAPGCREGRKVDVVVSCPGGVNALGLADIRAVSRTSLAWSGAALAVDWLRGSFVGSSDIGRYDADFTMSSAAATSIAMSGTPAPGSGYYYLVKADGPLNTVPLGLFCNSRSWRSGGASEIPEPARDAAFGNP